MSRTGRVRAEILAAGRSFLRRRTAVFFTFVFPLLIVVIFGVLVQTDAAGGGLFAEAPAWYVPGYLAVVVLFTPLSRVGSEVARHREGNRFEKLATTPLRRWEWLLGQTVVNVLIIGLAALVLLALILLATGARIALGPPALALVPLVVVGVGLFCALGAVIGSLAASQDGVIAASNAIALPLLFLSETFVPRTMLPGWFPTWLSPLTYFSRGVRAVTGTAGDLATPVGNGVGPAIAWHLAILGAATLVVFALAARWLPRTD